MQMSPKKEKKQSEIAQSTMLTKSKKYERCAPRNCTKIIANVQVVLGLLGGHFNGTCFNYFKSGKRPLNHHDENNRLSGLLAFFQHIVINAP